MLSDVIERYGGKKIDPLDVYKDIFRIGEGFIQKEYEKGSFKANPIAYYKNENEDHGHFRIDRVADYHSFFLQKKEELSD